ncbi:hypothetical protein TanjilG_10381 [Lupinus angustifolius]|uniref:Uncharacterized protein n=1 Tax=Lupinus angustifolius TaxID=3871 RepID=A0A4P1R4E2_LUPAN|nr:PREDICTED: uncharacterized protein LOC109359348 [Lupinus angustifolius]OIW01220.1 hypothetical protein TanjilG_10381 [Lupinus angustifolius]
MEGKKQVGSSSSSSSSFTSELFGSNPNQSPSSGIFGSIFSPPPKVLGRESLSSQLSAKTSNEGWNSKIDTQDYKYKCNDGETTSTERKDLSSIYHEQRVQPCHLSSSIYYGGQDIYSQPQNTHNSGFNTLYKKDGGEDDSGSASRGNWWQGSLYY